LLVIGYDTIEYASLTDVGVRRSHNQDAHATLLASDSTQWQERGHIFLVADGMGAHAVGELASDMSVNIIPHTYHKYALQGGVSALRKAFVEANASIHAKGQQNPEFSGMGTTTTALLLRPEGAWIGHVGDSRAYRVRNGTIEQISYDHSLVWEMAKRQGVDPEGLQGIPSNVIVRSLGPEPLVQVDVEGPYPVQPGDIFLLCSDGLSGQVSDHEIGAIASSLPPAEACRFLVDLANLRGGPDNITVLIVRIHDQPGKARPSNGRGRSGSNGVAWPLPTLLLGVLLVIGAFLLRHNHLYQPLDVIAFLLAAAAIVAGVIGMVIHFGREKERLAREPVTARPHVYRQAPCRVERPLVDKLARAVTALRDQIKERNWDVDWRTFEQNLDAAATQLNQGDLLESFRAYCRAMRLLAETVQRQRPKGDGFAPVWEK
jgi:protein phosphatase